MNVQRQLHHKLGLSRCLLKLCHQVIKNDVCDRTRQPGISNGQMLQIRLDGNVLREAERALGVFGHAAWTPGAWAEERPRVDTRSVFTVRSATLGKKAALAEGQAPAESPG